MEKVWLKHYQQGVPAEINPDEYSSLVSMFEESCARYADKPAYVNMGQQLSYEELGVKSRCFAAYLQSLGLNRGARVALMMPNCLQFPVALFGILQAGYVAVNTNPMYTADELVHQMNDSGAEVLIVLANFAHTVERSMPRMPNMKQLIVTELGDLFSPFKGYLVNFVIKYIKRLVPAYHLPQAITFNKALNSGKQLSVQPVVLGHEDIAFLQYTGGTTGVAKGAMLTHGNLLANILQASAWISTPGSGFSDQDIVVTALPLYHIFSLTANCLMFIKSGSKNILITNPRDLPRFINDIKNSGFTVITGVNTLFNALLNHPKMIEVDFSNLKIALSGGMSLQKSVSLRWHELTQKPILEAYGLTETSPAVTINPMYLTEYNGSIGLPLPSTDISIRDEDGAETGFNAAGELCIKGPQVMAGYWQRPDETANVMTVDGFLKTGDMAKIDENGFVYLVDRKKDLIIISGFNVYPNEIEQVIGMHPGVLEVGVIGVPIENGNEQVKACIVKRDPELSAEEIIAYCRNHLTAYKVPKIVEFYLELPKTNVGKILRRALREPRDIP